ncbi:MAG TPA: S-layer homology domain-containing protein, partial [Bacilli bacterium]
MSEPSTKFMKQYPKQPQHNRGGENKFMKKSLSLILVFAMIISMFSSLAFAADEMTAQEKYDALKAKGIISGFPDGSAGLDQKMTRAQFSVLVSKIYELDTTKPATATFTDVAATHWGFGFVEAATKAGYFVGTSADGKMFSPEANVTIEQMAIVYAKALDLALDPNAVVAGTSSWSTKYVDAAIDAGLIDADASFKSAALRSDLVNTSHAVNVIVEPTIALTVKSIAAVDKDNVTVTFS